MLTVDQRYDAALKLKDDGKLAEAADQLLALSAEEPAHVLTHSALAVILQKLSRFDEAIAHAQKVTELEPNDPFSYTQLSVICQRCGRIQAAEDALAQARIMNGGR